MKTLLKQYGLKRTGTNYCTVLMQTNYDCKVMSNGRGWKHGIYKMQEHVPTIVLIKHPISWMLSLKKYLKDGRKLNEFIFENIGHWNMMYRHWLENIPAPCYFLRYEDLLIDAKKHCGLVAKEFKLKYKRKNFHNPQVIIKPAEKVTKQAFSRKDYFLKKQYMKDIDEKWLPDYRAVVDQEIMGLFDYEI